MVRKTLVRIALAFAVCGGMTGSVLGDDPPTLVPTAIELKSEPCGDGWTRWDSIGNVEGAMTYRERITALAANQDEIWVGTSYGRLLTRQEDKWTLQGRLDGIQITGIAVENAGKVWLSTSDGIRRLERESDQPWRINEFRDYYEGHPSFVSGGYIPGENAVRLWGYVDDIYVPPGETAYSPLVISTEHGFFCWGGYGRVWHHYLPHYWGANSAWLDTRELVPHRRPTCIAEDGDGNLWIGTEWDGLIRLNAHARKYHNREPEKNKKDGTEFSFIGPKEIGCEFDRVADLAAADKGVWAVLTSREHGSALARFDGQSWVTHPLDGPARCVAEVEPGVVLIGVDGSEWGRYHGLRKVTWASKKIERPVGPEGVIHKIVRLTNGRVLAASWWSLFESDSTVKQAPAE